MPTETARLNYTTRRLAPSRRSEVLMHVAYACASIPAVIGLALVTGFAIARWDVLIHFAVATGVVGLVGLFVTSMCWAAYKVDLEGTSAGNDPDVAKHKRQLRTTTLAAVLCGVVCTAMGAYLVLNPVVSIAVNNRSSAKVQSVIINAPSGNRDLGAIAASTSKSLRVNAEPGGTLLVQYDVGGQVFTAEAASWVGPDDAPTHTISIDIRDGGSVAVDSQIVRAQPGQAVP
jgi:hypothetical protein